MYTILETTAQRHLSHGVESLGQQTHGFPEDLKCVTSVALDLEIDSLTFYFSSSH